MHFFRCFRNEQMKLFLVEVLFFVSWNYNLFLPLSRKKIFLNFHIDNPLTTIYEVSRCQIYLSPTCNVKKIVITVI